MRPHFCKINYHLIQSKAKYILVKYPFKNFSNNSLEKIEPKNNSKIEQIKRNVNYLKENNYKSITEDELANKFKEEINQKIFEKIFIIPSVDQKEVNSINDKNLIKFDKNNSLDIKTNFSLSLDRTFDLIDNKEISNLFFNNKLDLTKDNVQIKSLNLKDKELMENYKDDLLELDLGKLKSYPNLSNLTDDKLKFLRQNENYEFEVSLIGKKVTDDENLNLNNYGIYILALNEDDKHFISPLVFHDDTDEKKSKINYEETVFSTIIKNPTIIFLFIIFGYYFYPNLWKKDYFMAASEDYNNKRLSLNDEKIYDYINYRRGLYSSVRSNFS